MEDEFSRLVHAAIDGKYGLKSIGEVRALVHDYIRNLGQATSMDALRDGLSPTVDFPSDVLNQTRCLLAIEKFWRHECPSTNFIEQVHTLSYGYAMDEVCFRSANYVSDYGGEVPLDAGLVHGSLVKVNNDLQEVCELKDGQDSDQARFLSHIFTSIIQIHPFHDGNGRTARMVVEYCLRFWNMNYIVISKVRNSVSWKNVVAGAVDGNQEAMVEFFLGQLYPIG